MLIAIHNIAIQKPTHFYGLVEYLVPFHTCRSYVMITMEFKDLNQNLNMSPDELLDEVCKVIPASY